MSATMEQQPLPLRHKKQPLPLVKPPPIVPPRPWSLAVAALWKLPKSLLRLIQPELHLPIPRGPQKRQDWTVDPATLPYAVKPSKVIWLIQNQAPPAPLCFDSQAQWSEYLMYLHAEGQQITRRQDTGKHSGHRVVVDVIDPKRIDYCESCDIGGDRQRRMVKEGRCILPAAP
jgi:hypothetical protein